MPTLKELYEKRSAVVKKARDINEKALKEKRSMTAEEEANFDAAMDEADKIKAEIDAAVAEERRTSRLADHEDELNQSRGRRTSTETPGGDPESRGAQTPGVIEYRHALRFTGGERVLRFAGDATKSDAYNLAARAYLSGGMEGLSREHRSQLADSLKEGGFLVASQQMVAQLIQAADDAVYLRSLATVIQVPTAQSLGAVSLDADMDDAEWTSEVAEAPEDTGLEFGGRELTPKPLSKLVKISRKLIRCSTMPIERLVIERLSYKFNITQEKGFMTGTGVNQPLGLFTANSQGISTGRDVSTDNTTTAITGDGLINAKYSLKPQYLADPSCRWLFHRNAIRNIRKLKDLENRYIWQEGLSKDKPDTILEIPYLMSEYVPATFTSSQYVGMIGAFRHYMIAEAMGLDIQRLVELYARTNQTGFIGRAEIDGMPALEEAFARVQLAAG